jgi:D-arabinose 1-dehydrogenase-like Zn-dependent alcohol dehydrogenase
MPTNTMKAIRLHEFGGPEVLRYEEVAIPELKPGEDPRFNGSTVR